MRYIPEDSSFYNPTDLYLEDGIAQSVYGLATG
jgi:hypothetical protein